MGRVRGMLSYANVMATAAVFIALGGSSYAAVKVARNSVGSAQIRAKAVGSSELRGNAVTSSRIRDRTIQTQDLSTVTRTFLKGQAGAAGPPGPAGPSGVVFRAAVNSGGGVAAGNGTAAGSRTGSAVIAFERSVAGCVFAATPALVAGGVNSDPTAGRVLVAEEDGKVRVFMYDRNGDPANFPFNLLVAC